jgi:hypothetical protein
MCNNLLEYHIVMLPSRLGSIIGTNIFGDIWTSYKSLKYSYTSSKGQTPRFHTPRYVQGLEAELDEHRIIVSMFQHVTKYKT